MAGLRLKTWGKQGPCAWWGQSFRWKRTEREGLRPKIQGGPACRHRGQSPGKPGLLQPPDEIMLLVTRSPCQVPSGLTTQRGQGEQSLLSGRAGLRAALALGGLGADGRQHRLPPSAPQAGNWLVLLWAGSSWSSTLGWELVELVLLEQELDWTTLHGLELRLDFLRLELLKI